MNASYIVPIMFVLFFVIFARERESKAAVKRIIQRKKERRKGGSGEMIELAKRFVGRDCIVYMYNGQQLLGRIEEVGDSGIMLRSEKDTVAQLVNADFILRIREHPIGKNGKKKSVVLD